MRRRLPLLLFSLAACLTAQPADDFFESKIRPLFAANCYACHTQSQMGGLRLDSGEAVLKGGKSGPAVIPGKPDESLLIQAVRRTHSRLKMPPTAPLKADEVALLEAWVKAGAKWPEAKAAAAPGMKVSAAQRAFWSFQPLRNPTPPAVKNEAWVRTPVDRFILARLEGKGITPNRRASKTTLLRRATLDLTGLPPTPEEVDAFLSDQSPEAFAKVVDRLLASPAYGERWARHWLDLARYSDGLLAAGTDTPLPNAYRYRDWVVNAFNHDLPYDQFVKAQIAADLLPESERAGLLPGLGFQAIAAGANDQVDVTTKAFLGLTVGCAQCHDHKYDPIPTRDYYSLLSIFKSSKVHESPLVPEAEVKAYKDQKKKMDAVKELIDEYVQTQQKMLVDVLARHTAAYMVAAWKLDKGQEPDRTGLDEETLQRWVRYLKPPKEHPYLNDWFALMAKNPTEAQVRKAAEDYQKFVLNLLDEAKEIDDKNYVAFGGKKGMKDERTRQYTNIVSLSTLKFYQWRELASGPYKVDGFSAPPGVYYYDVQCIQRFLTGVWGEHLETLRAEYEALKQDLPPIYPFLHTIEDGPKPADGKVAIRGDEHNPGEVAPRQFLTVLCKGEPEHYTKGSGRLELAQAIAAHPLTARVIVNRIWQHHFGHGIVRSASNFGQMGDRPTHPDLLDYLASRLVQSGYSLKAIHREILLSNTYALSTEPNHEAMEADPDNKLLWRANLRPRLDMESLRDSVLAVSGMLDRAVGGPSSPMSGFNHRRSLYLTVSRTRLDPTMSLFDFPDPNGTTEERPVTIGPLQGLFFLNSEFIVEQSKALAAEIAQAGRDDKARVTRAYKMLYGREPDADELRLGIEYVSSGGNSWREYVQVLLGSGEFTGMP
ncbi:MAG: PSD1 domain-containing protein [Bryobacterales bacterium]|nr:PSD1 domain-containing protein [Bryobacterales bacterium]